MSLPNQANAAANELEQLLKADPTDLNRY